MTGQLIYVVDQVVLKPGCAKAFVDAYTHEYSPVARDRGMAFDRMLISPPIWFEDETNTVTATWTVHGQAEWWKAAVKGRHDPGPARWWAKMDPMIVERSRSMAASIDDVDGLCDV
ncbi:conserved hypothetical protein (plasmid) [Rhodococcus jostii RHA1]|uniref:NIPSNAP domain-containing protein n=1 Tax=Rhodococcus jostii (strain RHA1) TaxID=101510 RepID=Q0RXC6_RHOJR|nr:hypothetical protein [Rhodococcus jostii]ABH00060.1 conserved hypothetical protein [Rhodococcus jostii RHA1]